MSSATESSRSRAGSAGSRRWAASCATAVPGRPHERTGLTLDGLKLLKAYQRQDVEAIAGLRLGAGDGARGRDARCATSSATCSSATPDRSPSSTRSGSSRRARSTTERGSPSPHQPVLMPTVELRDIVTEDDDEAVMGLRRGPGQERYLGPDDQPLRGRDQRREGLPADVVRPRRRDRVSSSAS